ncbi:MAG: gliding motility-associated C-terminal domain-containing protein, partial [Bacteroidota bacterium]
NGANTAAVSGLLAGSYTVTITDTNACTASASVVITQPAIITATISKTNIACFGENNGVVTIAPTGGTAPYSYNWSNGGNTITITGLIAGNYLVTITDQNGCTSSTNATITQPIVLTSSIGISENVSCYGGNNGAASVIINGGTSPYTYNWSNGANTVNNTGLVVGTYTVTITDTNHCTASTSVAITQPNQLTIAAYGSTTVCQGNSVTIGTNVSGGTPPYYYHWNHNLDNNTTHAVVVMDTTNYNVFATDANGCITDTSFVILNINSPLIGIHSEPNAICKGTSATLNLAVSGGVGPYNFMWNNGLGNLAPPITVSPEVTTNYIVMITDACNSTPKIDTIEIQVNPLPTPNISANNLKGCGTLETSFVDYNFPESNTYHWDFGDPNAGANNFSNSQQPTHFYSQVGTYNLTITITNLFGCATTVTYPMLVTVYEKPIASFQLDKISCSIDDPIIRCTDESWDAMVWNWNFGEPTSGQSNYSTETNPFHIYSEFGKHTISLYVENEHGCIDTTSKEIIVYDYATFFAPNAFTPNGDGVNDFFITKGTNIAPDGFNLLIYNRWGEKVFESNDIDRGWDGFNASGSTECKEDVYTWTASVKYLMGGMHVYIGTCTLFR